MLYKNKIFIFYLIDHGDFLIILYMVQVPNKNFKFATFERYLFRDNKILYPEVY